jgi:hypothetical protein
MAMLLAGFVSGILASFIAWFIVQHLFVPSLKFQPQIRRRQTDAVLCGYQYCGRRDILDVEFFAKLRVLGIDSARPNLWRAFYIPVDDARLPRVPAYAVNTVQLLPSSLPATAASALPLALRERLQAQTLTLEQLVGSGRVWTLEVFAFGYDAFSGSRKVAQSVTYKQDSIVDEKIDAPNASAASPDAGEEAAAQRSDVGRC